jgi:hypothetical protein
MNAILALLALAISPPFAQARVACSLDRVGISVMITSEDRGPLGNFDAADGESEEGRNTCSGYLEQFRIAYAQARALATKECDSFADNVNIRVVAESTAANSAKLVLGAEFPQACNEP